MLPEELLATIPDFKSGESTPVFAEDPPVLARTHSELVQVDKEDLITSFTSAVKRRDDEIKELRRAVRQLRSATG